LRAPFFVGLREDKPPEEVVQEPAAIAPPSTSTALDLSGRETTLTVDGHRLKFTNLDKLLFPKDRCKKRDVIQFYDRVSLWLLPHLKDRPLSLKRYPNGIAKQFFFQKNAADHFPDWMRCEPIRESSKVNHYVVAEDRATLLYLANLGCIEQNPWMSRIGKLDRPDWMLLDLDPVDTGAEGPPPEEPQHALDGLGRPLEHGLDGAVPPVAHPAADAGLAGHIPGRLAEADGLNAALDDHAPAAHRGMLPAPAGRCEALLPLRGRCYPPVVRRPAVHLSF